MNDNNVNGSTAGYLRESMVQLYSAREALPKIQDDKETTEDNRNILDNSDFEIIQIANQGNLYR